MTNNDDASFAGSIPVVYESVLVPLLFDQYAVLMAERVAARNPARVLELAAGTGAVTRELAARTPVSTELVATDLNQAMIDQAMQIGSTRPVEWKRADAMQLPFEGMTFDAVVCQFGVMFFPDRVAAYGEVLRVLRPNGAFLFSVWDTLETNEIAEVTTAAVGRLFPQSPPRFLSRTPYAYHQPEVIERDLRGAGFTRPPRFETHSLRSRPATARAAAIAFCHGTPLRTEIEALGPSALERATDAAAEALAATFGEGDIETTMQAIMVTVEKP
jgi:ubiquinone/menaquinone biosynthesis C-methylase UbiE